MFQNSFELRHVIKKYADLTEECSEIVENLGVKWLLQAKKDKNNLQIDVICLNDVGKNENWWIRANLDLQMPSTSSELKREPGNSKRVLFNKEKASFTFKFISGDVTKAHEGDKEVIVECQLEITNIRGIAQKRKMAAEELGEGQGSTVTLVVGDKKIKVSRVLLATSSAHFKKQFFGSASNKKKTEFALGDDVDTTDFENLLEVLNGNRIMTGDNIGGILKLAKLYDMQIVKEECELFLMKDKEIDKRKKFKLITEFGFEELKEEMFESVKSLKDLQEVMPSSMDDLDESTVRAIAERFVQGNFI